MIPIQVHRRSVASDEPGVQLKSLPPLSLYIHVPWCVRKCPYCDFNSHEFEGALPEDAYLAALEADIVASLPLVWGRRIHTVFIGGGTPSLLSADAMDRLLAMVRALLPIEADAEVTLEANPGTFEAERFRAFRDSGINRLSIGIQSFSDDALKRLGRIHDRAQALGAIRTAQDTFDNFNLDVMFGLPGQRIEEALEDVRRAIDTGANHLSFYQLTLEPNTVFAKYPPALPDEDATAEIEEAVRDCLKTAGYHHYETSAHAKDGFACKHNLNYWNFGDYLGVGAGAHGKLSFPNRIVRTTKLRQPASYLGASPAGLTASETAVTRRDLPFEFMMNAMRLTDGVPVERFSERTGLSMAALEPARTQAEARGLLDSQLGMLRPTVLGQRFLNDLLELFLPQVGA